MLQVSRALLLCLALPLSAHADVTEWQDQGSAHPGSLGTPLLVGSGNLAPAGSFQLTLTGVQPNSAAILVVGLSDLSVPFLGGILVPNPDVVLGPLGTGAAGSIDFQANLTPDYPAGTDLWFQFWTGDAGAVGGASGSNALRGTESTAPLAGTFPNAWISGGPDCGSEPPVQVHHYEPDFVILRQSLCTNFEAPFIYLIFGDDRVLMLDTGAGPIGPTLRQTVFNIIVQWLQQNGKNSTDLVVVHSHGHGDHKAGDNDLATLPNTTVVGANVTAVRQFFGITNWPTEIVSYDLGNRVLDIIPIPGHESSHIAIYDRRTATLLTGDSLYPGRLYVFGAQSQNLWPVYQASIQRLVDFVATRDLCWVLGTHIEMSATPGVDFNLGATHHPSERVLQLERRHLIELNDAITAMGANPVVEVHPDFIITPIN